MNLITKYKNILTIGVVLLAAFVAYSVFLKPDTSAPLTATAINATQSAVDQELITLLSQLRSISLDVAIFSDEQFHSLKDFSQEIVPEPVGRTNPFAPLSQ